MCKLALLFLGAAIELSAADPRIGHWALVSAQSEMNPKRNISITPLRNQVHIVISGDTQIDFVADGKGRETAVEGIAAFNQIEWRKIDKNQTEITEKKNGLVVATLRNRLSNDHGELTITTSENGHPDQISVWVRSGGAKVAANPFVGDWTEDLSKTRLRQGLLLKIEAEGKEGVRFSGDFSYAARFDGKDYVLKNSRNDTVTLQLVDPHTVDSIYKRGDQPAEKDRWIVSPEGQQMTVIMTGVLETGQRIKETLVFRKQ